MAQLFAMGIYTDIWALPLFTPMVDPLICRLEAPVK